MNNIKPTDKAFPSDIYQNSGMDVRTYIAARIMAGSVPDPYGDVPSIKEKAELAVLAADALIEELNKPKTTPYQP